VRPSNGGTTALDDISITIFILLGRPSFRVLHIRSGVYINSIQGGGGTNHPKVHPEEADRHRPLRLRDLEESGRQG
jgi:hypothetical protein